jgi:hypothetical protein
MLYPVLAAVSDDSPRIALRSLTTSSEGSDQLGRAWLSRLWYPFLSSNRAYLISRTRDKTIPVSYRITVGSDERAAVLRMVHGFTAIAGEVRVTSSNTTVRRIKSNARN